MSSVPLKRSEVSSLVAIIANSAGIIESHYEMGSKHYVPSLTDIDPHPLDTGLSPSELRTATQMLEGACAQLCTLLTRPNHNLLNKFMSLYLPVCLNIVLNAKVVDAVGTNPMGMPIEKISEITGIEGNKLGRVLRMLCAHHIFTEVSANTFANNRLSIQLRASDPLASVGLHVTEEHYRAAHHLYETLSDPEWGVSDAHHHSAFNKQTGYPGPLFMYYEGKDNEKGAELGARFGRGLSAFNDASESHAIIKDFPWHKFPDGTIINDVGGGVGYTSMHLARAYPHLKLKLQDLPERIRQAQNKIWPLECPKAIEESRIEFKPVDFLKESPIADCDIYYLQHIIHDWPDADAVTILTNVRKAMGPQSRVLIHEHVLQPANRVSDEECSFTQAPEPLLPNFGVGRCRQYDMDMGMMCLLNSQERQLDEFVKLGKAAGLEFHRLWDFGEMGAVELRLPQA